MLYDENDEFPPDARESYEQWLDDQEREAAEIENYLSEKAAFEHDYSEAAKMLAGGLI